jgi:hypothetical protein
MANNKNHYFKKGDPKPANSGRKKGVKNKRTYQLLEVLDNFGFDAVGEFLRCVALIEDPKDRAGEIAKLFPFMMPRLATLQVSQKTPELEEIESMSTMELEEKVKQHLLGEKHEAETKTDS